MLIYCYKNTTLYSTPYTKDTTIHIEVHIDLQTHIGTINSRGQFILFCLLNLFKKNLKKQHLKNILYIFLYGFFFLNFF